MRETEISEFELAMPFGGSHIYSYVLPPGEAFPVGDFRYEVATQAWTWSTEAFHIHGFEPGEVVPTTRLVLAHKHPGDRDGFAALFDQVCTQGGTMASHHRIIDGLGRTRRVIVVARSVMGVGGVTAVIGHFIDLSRIMESETSVIADEAVARAVEKRHVIEQAKGVLMERFSIDAEAAFEMLAHASQHSHEKLRDVAGQLIGTLSKAQGNPAADRQASQDTGT